MAVSVVMPALEMAQETGKLVSWLKREGDHVRKGELLLEIETDKAVVEVEAAADGILAGITAQAGDVVPVGQPIAWLVRDGEAPPTTDAPVVTGRRMDSAPATAAPVAAAVARPAAEGQRLSPRARRLAQEHGVDLSRVTGSGPGGEVLADDVLKHAASVAAPAAPPAALSAIGQLMAERTTASWTTVPHFFLFREVDAQALIAARETLTPVVQRSHGVKPTITDLLAVAVARALQKHPRMNASWTAGGVVTNDAVNVALAIAVEAAVVTGVLRDAADAGVGNLAKARLEVAERARAGKLKPSDVTGGTFTISNLGMFGVDAFTAIIVPPQAAILAVGAIVDRVVAVGGQAVVRPRLTLTLSTDHRVADGATAARFLDDVVRLLQGSESVWTA